MAAVRTWGGHGDGVVLALTSVCGLFVVEGRKKSLSSRGGEQRGEKEKVWRKVVARNPRAQSAGFTCAEGPQNPPP